MDSIKKQARGAGILYFLACITAPFSLIYVPHALFVPGDATATADHIRASEAILHLGIASELIGTTILIFAVLAFYRLFKGVDERHALAMATLILISVPISFFNVLNEIAALVFAKGAASLSAFDKPQLDAFAFLFLRLHGQGLIVAQIFWGLWLFPFGILVMRSGFIPRLLGVFLMFAGSAYVASSLTALFFPQHQHLVGQLATVLEVGEVPLIFWLLIWGAKAQPQVARK